MNPHRDLTLSFFAPLIETVSGIIQRPRLTKALNEGSSVNVSARALIIRLPMERSAAQWGINRQVHEPALVTALVPDRTMTGMFGEVSGAMLKRGVYFGRSPSRLQRTRMSLNSNVAVNRPHISGKFNVVLREGQQLTNCRSRYDNR
jgi:hypothetical protein